MMILAWGMPSGPEFLLILLVLVFFFGAKRLPELARSIGRSLTEFKKGREDGALADGEQPTSADHRSEPNGRAG